MTELFKADSSFIRLIETLRHLTPSIEKVKQIIDSHIRLWRQPPYLHERKLILAYAYILEKDSSGKLDESDVKAVASFFSWIASLEPKQAEQENPQKEQ